MKIAALAIAISLTGCAAVRNMGNDAPPGVTIGIATFDCNCDPIIQTTVQDAFVEVFFNHTTASPQKGQGGQIVIRGTIATDVGATQKTSAVTEGSASGAYVTGITIQVYKGETMIATKTIAQNLSGGRILSPVYLAQQGATMISRELISKNEIGPK